MGVLQVLDRPAESKLRLAEVDLLGLFANQAAIALDLLQRARRARQALEGEGRLAPLARVAAGSRKVSATRRSSSSARSSGF